jgi:DHA1 family multidrug resistance protein-like MFS transporter
MGGFNENDATYESEIDSRSDESDDIIDHVDTLELTRINTYRLQQKTTVGSTRGPIPRERWLPMGANKEYPPMLPDSEAYVVEFDGADDPLHPSNWSMTRRYVNLQQLRCLHQCMIADR